MELTRRGLLRGALAAGCSLAAHPLVTPVALASAPGEGRLVVIVLRGGMDGLDVVRPVEDRLLAELRPALLGAEPGLPLSGGFALHPGLGALAPLWAAGELGFVHAVSTPYRDKRSHFDGQDILEAGTPGAASGSDSGWLNRVLAHLPASRGETAYAVGNETRLILAGPQDHGRWQPGASVQVSPQTAMLLDSVYRDDPAFGTAFSRALILSEELRDEGEAASGVEALAAFAASRLNGEARIAAFSISGWDTHSSQSKLILPPLARLAAAILRLKTDLGGNWGRTAVLAMTEFGRTARQNGSGGTDHGTGGLLLLAGGAVRGGEVLGDWPGLGEGRLYADRDLMPTADVRSYAGLALAGLFGLPRSVVEQQVFPGADLAGLPAILR